MVLKFWKPDGKSTECTWACISSAHGSFGGVSVAMMRAEVVQLDREPEPFPPVTNGPGCTEHRGYVSTACRHGKPEQCRLTCKFCDTPCTCWCHDEPEDSLAAGYGCPGSRHDEAEENP